MAFLTPKKQRLLDWLEDYIYAHHRVPSYDEMTEAMGYRSKNTVRVHLNDLRVAGYIDWQDRNARSIQICRPRLRNIPILGTIAAGGLVETFPDAPPEEYVDISTLPYFMGKSRQQMAQHFALRVRGDSMIGAAIAHNDIVVLRKEFDPLVVKEGQIVAARVGTRTTLKYFHHAEGKIVLRPANPSYDPISVEPEDVEIEGVYIGLLRGLV